MKAKEKTEMKNNNERMMNEVKDIVNYYEREQEEKIRQELEHDKMKYNQQYF